MEFSVQQIALLLEGTIEGDPSGRISGAARIQEAKAGQIAFLANPKYEQFIYGTGATAVIVNHDFEARKPVASTLIRVKDAYSAFTRLLEEYNRIMAGSRTGVEEPSHIGKGTVAGSDLYRGAFSYIGDHVTLGNHVSIHPHAFIGERCVIGDHVTIHSGVKIYAGTRIGDHCEIHAGTVIGSDGFGFAPQADGSYKAIPQLGTVVIEDNVTIGANTVIDCATMPGDHTVIRKGVKLDNLIQIAHNVEIGSNTVIAAQAGISGSTKVGEQCMIGGQTGVAGHLVIADKVAIGGQSGVTSSIEEAGAKVFGTPAMPLSSFFKSYAIFKRLPELYNKLRSIDQKGS